jgi:hypothetical protein
MSKDLEKKLSKAAKEEMKHPDENGDFFFYLMLGFVGLVILGGFIKAIWQYL